LNTINVDQLPRAVAVAARSSPPEWSATKLVRLVDVDTVGLDELFHTDAVALPNSQVEWSVSFKVSLVDVDTLISLEQQQFHTDGVAIGSGQMESSATSTVNLVDVDTTLIVTGDPHPVEVTELSGKRRVGGTGREGQTPV
jgi:hypothetical protein